MYQSRCIATEKDIGNFIVELLWSSRTRCCRWITAIPRWELRLMLHTSLYMYIAKFLNVCIRTRSLSRASCIPYLRTYFGSDTVRVGECKKEREKEIRICSPREDAFDSFTALNKNELLCRGLLGRTE